MSEIQNPMGTRKIFPLLVSMSIPPIISMMIQGLYNIVDSIFVAHVSQEALTAVSLVYPLQNLTLSLAVGLGVGLNACIARSLGSGNRQEAGNAAIHDLLCTGLHSILFLLVGLFASRPFLLLFTQDETVLELGCQYSTIVICLSFGSLFHICARELKNVFKDQGVLIFFILVPLAYPLVYAFIYTQEVVRDVPAAVVDNSRSSLSREFIRMVDATPDIKVQSYCADMEEAQNLIEEGRVYGIIYIPEEFARNISQGKQVSVSIFSDMSGLLYYKSLLMATTNVSLDMNKDIKIERMGNTTARQDEIGTAPIEYEDISLFNPQDGFASFLIPAVLILVIQQTLLLGIGLSAGTARETNKFQDLVPLSRKYNGTLRIVLGKSLAYFLIYAIVSAYVLCVVPRMFSLVQIPNPTTLLLFILPYLSACIFFAMTCSIFIHHRESCMMIYVFTSVPLLFISGISWPGAAIPDFWKVVSWIFPSTFGINGFVRINSMGATLPDVLTEFRALWLQTGIYFITTCIVYRRQIQISHRHVEEKLRKVRKYFRLKKKTVITQ